MSNDEQGGEHFEDRQDPSARPPYPDPCGRPARHRLLFFALLLVLCSFVGGFFGGRYGETWNVTPYYGPRSAVGLQLPTAGELIAGLWGALPATVLGGLLGGAALSLRVRMDVAPVGYGARSGALIGFITGGFAGGAHTWIHVAVTGLVLGALIALLGFYGTD